MDNLKLANRLLPLPALERYQKIHRILYHRKLTSLQSKLAELIDQTTKYTFVFPPSLDWIGQLFQRPQQMALALAEQGCQVVYFQHREHWEAEPFREIRPRLLLCSVPVEAFWELPSERLITYAMTWNCRLALAPNVDQIIYDLVDDLSVFPGSQTRLASDHLAITARSRLVLATSENLLAQVKILRPDSLLCPNGVDQTFFALARNADLAAPKDLLPILADGKPLAGYIGALAPWVDYSLLEFSAKSRSDWHFVLVGPSHDQSLPASLLELPNLHWLDAKPYAELPAYLRHFNAALIPFQLNPVTHAASPLKLFEYMAAGKPVISTPIHEALKIPGILLIRDAQDMSSQLDQALIMGVDPNYLAQSDQFARQNTWQARAQQIIDALEQSQPLV